VSPFAAGCAICGADLDTKRWDTGPSVANRAGSWFSSLGMGRSLSSRWILILVIFLLCGGAGLIASLLYAL
jgi:hypothetical protein